jgi:hypothetical protein
MTSHGQRRPIILGRIRFPRDGSMIMQTNSIQRAIGAAGFFAPRLGLKSELLRCRLVNRWFAAGEGQPNQLMMILDRNVTVIDSREADAAFKQAFRGVRTQADAERNAAQSLGRKLKSQEDVPMVEDFPLAPETETSEFTNLTLTLQLRLVRAMEHWRGNTDLTLAALILRTVKAGIADGAIR